MRDDDLGRFQQLLGKMASVFGKKLDESIAPTYFRVLQGCDFVDVARAADSLIATEKFFPKPAQWLAAVRETPKGEALAEMPAGEVATWLDAERRRYEADPCSCGDCMDAGVNERPLRFVPNEDSWGGNDRRMLGSREVVRGHWAHGFDLARWYKARADCYEVFMRVKLGHPLKQAEKQIFPREAA